LRLTDEEKAIRDGSQGEGARKGLEFIVRYGQVLGAERLCTVSRAHLFAGSHAYLKAIGKADIDEAITTMHLCATGKTVIDRVACPSQTDAGPMDPERWRDLALSPQEAEENARYLERYRQAGIHLVGSCVPYMLGFIPLMGEHYVSTESHAIIFMNSLWGACANADGIEAAWCSALCGRTPYWGNHVPSERRGTLLFRVEAPLTTLEDWNLLGFLVGKATPPRGIPVIAGLDRPDFEGLRSAFAAMATTGGVELCFIEGVTPEAPTLERAFGGAVPSEAVLLGKREFLEARDFLCAPSGPVRFVSLGCPHYSVEQLRRTAFFLRGQHVAPAVELQVWTAMPFREVADRCGYTAEIERAGGKVLCGSCPILTGSYPRGEGGLAFDSAKQANYMKPRVSDPVFFGSPRLCLEAALRGHWEG
jgi:hypothetical protein